MAHVVLDLAGDTMSSARLVHRLTFSFRYEGRTAAEQGLVFGHENMGVITEVGSGVTLLKKGDRIVLPFNVADGRCRNCEEGKTGTHSRWTAARASLTSSISLLHWCQSRIRRVS